MSLTDITTDYLEFLKPCYTEKGYDIPKWIIFCETMLNKNWDIKLNRSKSTVSKYLYLSKDNRKYKIRFSNHRANYEKEINNDCDYYVGVGNLGIITTEELIEMIGD